MALNAQKRKKTYRIGWSEWIYGEEGTEECIKFKILLSNNNTNITGHKIKN